MSRAIFVLTVDFTRPEWCTLRNLGETQQVSRLVGREAFDVRDKSEACPTHGKGASLKTPRSPLHAFLTNATPNAPSRRDAQLTDSRLRYMLLPFHPKPRPQARATSLCAYYR